MIKVTKRLEELLRILNKNKTLGAGYRIKIVDNEIHEPIKIKKNHTLDIKKILTETTHGGFLNHEVIILECFWINNDNSQEETLCSKNEFNEKLGKSLDIGYIDIEGCL